MSLRSGPVVIGFDGSSASERALREGGDLLATRTALVVVVWEAGLAFGALELPTSSVGLPPAPIDVRGALEVEDAMYERAQRMAQHGADLAKQAGMEAEGLAVADEVTVAETLTRVAQERDAQALVVGTRGHGGLGKVLLGSTAEAVIRKAPCPVLVVRETAH
jgi:nucleotide-binding universal stress UspA family protein